MSKHTPGPWKVHNYMTDMGPYNKAIDVGPNQKMVTRVCGEFDQPVPGDEAWANARLIAAAPTLLNALQDVVDCAQSEGRLFAAVVQNARDAIAKAEGVS